MIVPGNLNGVQLWNLGGLGMTNKVYGRAFKKQRRRAALNAKLAAMTPEERAAWTAKKEARRAARKAKAKAKKADLNGWLRGFAGWIGF